MKLLFEIEIVNMPTPTIRTTPDPEGDVKVVARGVERALDRLRLPYFRPYRYQTLETAEDFQNLAPHEFPATYDMRARFIGVGVE